MKYIENDVASVHYNENESLKNSISKFCRIVKDNPSVLVPVKDADADVKAILNAEGFELYPTVKKTTLFYDRDTDGFFKILHPLSLKHRVLYSLFDKSRAIYELSEELHSHGIKAMRVIAFGLIKKGSRPFFVSKRVAGDCLNNILIREKNALTMDEYRSVIDEVAKIHSHGYWLGDAHLAHIFIKDGEVTGFIDIDSIRRNRPYKLKNIIKDIAGLNHPELPLSDDEKRSLLNYYLGRVGSADNGKFPELLKRYTERRWGD